MGGVEVVRGDDGGGRDPDGRSEGDPFGLGGGVAEPSVEDPVLEEGVEPRRRVEDGVDGQVEVFGGRVVAGGAGHHQQAPPGILHPDVESPRRPRRDLDPAPRGLPERTRQVPSRAPHLLLEHRPPLRRIVRVPQPRPRLFLDVQRTVHRLPRVQQVEVEPVHRERVLRGTSHVEHHAADGVRGAEAGEAPPDGVGGRWHPVIHPADGDLGGVRRGARGRGEGEGAAREIFVAGIGA
mmetsp:Transcript_48244/g.94257  ORF Transcript_48244/g.94257 Transcript_48244/m.94257 type:complete len:237 (-) Transcript_48244:369-1079(-)